MKINYRRILSAFLVVSLMATMLLNGTYQSNKVNALQSGNFNYSKDFTGINVNTLDEDFTSAIVSSNGSIEEGLPSKQWTTAANPDGNTQWKFQNNYLKPTLYGGKTFLLTLKDVELVNFTASIEFLNSWKEYGIIFGQATPIDTAVTRTSTNGAVKVRMQENAGKILVQGIDTSTPKWVNSDITTQFYSQNNPSYVETYDNLARPGFSTDVNSTNIHTLNMEVKDGVLKVWWTGYEDYAWTVKLNEKYRGGYISLYSTGAQQGGIKKFSISGEGYEAVNGDNCDFTTLKSLSQLDRDFDSYLFEKGSNDGVKGDVAKNWTLSENLPSYETAYHNPWLKPMHRNNGNTTLLTYTIKQFTNVDITTEYVTNYVRYGVMIAPLGNLSTNENGIRVFVESDGVINIQGAVDAGSASAVGGQVKVTDKNALSGYPISGYKAPSNKDNSISKTSYNLRVKILDNIITVWLDEFSNYVISAPLTDDFKGGYVSLYSSAYDQGAFKTFKCEELIGSDLPETDADYNLSFNTINSLDEIENIGFYKFDGTNEKPQTAKIDELFTLQKGRLTSNLSSRGTDSSGFAILTLEHKKYKNFELILKYEQDWLRYGVMVGTEKGEFAFTNNGKRLVGNGGVLVYTEAEGYSNIKGSLYASTYTDAKNVLHRAGIGKTLQSFNSFGNVEKTLNYKPVHTMKIRVVNGYMTMVTDGDTETRITVRLSDYDGGYVSIVTNAEKSRACGAVYSIKITELEDDADLEDKIPETSGRFETINQVAKEFDAYYLEDASVSTELKKVDIKEHWWINNGGFLSRNNGASGIKETSDIELLTYAKRKFTDFELTYTYQQTYQRLGIVIGGDLKNYPLSVNNGKITANKGSVFYVEAEGYPNVKGHLNNYTSLNYMIYRTTSPVSSGFTDFDNNAAENVNIKKLHTIKIVVKDKKLYAFIDGNEKPSLYVKLGDNYNGGYVSLFSSASDVYGFYDFEISEKITTKLPNASGTTVSGNNYLADFNSVVFDDSAFTAYYLEKLFGNEDGSLIKQDFDDQWTVANNTIERNSLIENGSDASRVSVLTYNKPLTDFIVSYDYQKWDKRLMFMFGTEKGKYPLCNKGEGDLENGGILLYPENDLGAGGGLIVLGGVSRLTASYRPVNYQKITLNGYHVKDLNKSDDENWKYGFGSWHRLTVAVINKHCYIYLDDYGMIADYALTEDYNGGYISFAAAASGYGFDNISITDLSSVTANSIIAVENPRDITVKSGTAIENIELPKTVKATLKNGKTVTLPVSFTAFDYDADKEGSYRFTALLPKTADVKNPAMVSAVVNVRVKENIPASLGNVNYWSFDTDDDLLDFKAFYVLNAESGYSDRDLSRWYCGNGKLLRDATRTKQGSSTDNIALLTYTGETYKNFELEVEYTQHYNRVGVLFGSKEIGQYIDLNDVHSKNNPVAAFVEYEGIRNFIGNVKNTNYYTRIDETIYNARENSGGIDNYYSKVNGHTGNVHKMRIRVVGDKVMMWINETKDPFVATLTDYTGGYISLFSTAKGGSFDNLKITRLDENGNVLANDPEIMAKGDLELGIDSNASTELVVPSGKKPDGFKNDDKKTVNTINTVRTSDIVIGSVILVFIFALSVCFLIILKKRRKI